MLQGSVSTIARSSTEGHINMKVSEATISIPGTPVNHNTREELWNSLEVGIRKDKSEDQSQDYKRFAC